MSSKQRVGKVKIQVVKAQDLVLAKSSWWGSSSSSTVGKRSSVSCHPYVMVTFGEESVKTSAIPNNCNPTWRKEVLELPVYKPEGDVTNVELTFDVFSQDSLAKKAGECIGLSDGGSLIGSAILNITDLIDGQVEMMDRWLSLQNGVPGKEKDKLGRCGDVHVIVAYDPIGLEPRVGDLIQFVGYGMYPERILPPRESLYLTVTATSGNYILAEYTSSCGFPCSIRIHRNCVYVAQRSSWMDRALSLCVYKPVQFAKQTPIGQKITVAASPYVQVLATMSAPIFMAFRTMSLTTIRATTAAIVAVLYTD